MEISIGYALIAAAFFFGILIGLLLGIAIVKRVGQGKNGAHEGELRELRQSLIDSRASQAKLESRIEADREHHQRQLEILQDARNQLLSDFKASAGSMMENRQRQFSQDSSRQINQLLKPLQDTIQGFSRQMQDYRAKDAQDRGFLKKELEQLMELNRQMSDDARNLTDALKGSNKTMGTWGELILSRVLESSGLEAGREYRLQQEFKAGDGRRYRPDAVLYLPEGRNIIIDSKVSMLSYERAHNALTEDERQAHLKKHLVSLRQHVNELSAKEYDRLDGLQAPDFVLMFVPVEGALSTAQQSDPTLFQTAMDRKILMVGPASLYLSLRIVEQMWKGDRQQRNAREIAEKAGALHDKFAGFAADVQKIGDKLAEAREAWQSAGRKLSSGRGNLINRVRALKELGAETGKDIQKIDLKDEI